GREFAASARLSRHFGARRPSRRPRARYGRPRRGADAARSDVRGAAGQPADRAGRDRAGERVTRPAPRPLVAVVVFPGSNDEGDAALALESLGADARLVWHADHELPDGTAAAVLPGGFSYGDYLRCGAIARLAPMMDAVRELAAHGAPVLGICNGFQILC